ncbi:hypothetical protein [Kitasatospora sp. NPDC088783]|uniref:hypothetical protein n=1 Tax=Kitasatospora sp. NPDC088783 TaxID=3364077 RepID=UPI0037FB4B69
MDRFDGYRRDALRFERPAELAGLRDALVSGEFDHLMRDSHEHLRRPTVDAEVAAMGERLRRPRYRELLRTVTGR